jgi:hypothetical protein
MPIYLFTLWGTKGSYFLIGTYTCLLLRQNHPMDVNDSQYMLRTQYDTQLGRQLDLVTKP